MAMLPPPPTKPITLPYLSGFSGGKKEESMLSHIQRERSKLQEDRAYKYGGNTGSRLRDAIGSYYKKELIRLRNSILPEP